MTLVALLGLPLATSEAALLSRAGAWSPAEAPAPAPVGPAAPSEAVPVQKPAAEAVAPPPTPSEPTAPPPTSTPPLTSTPPPTTTPPAEGQPEVTPPPAEATTEPTPVEAFRTITPASEPMMAPRLAPPPPPGAGMRVGGGILIGVGVLDAIVGGFALAAANRLESDPTFASADVRPIRVAGAIHLVGGLVEVGAGVGMVVAGVRRAKRLKAWESEHAMAVPKTGNGMIVGGSVLLGVGALDGLALGITASQAGGVAPFDVVVTVSEVAAGAVLLGVGLARKKRYRAWEERSFVAPSVTQLPGGMAMGLRGRF